jgi:hypothetical protein
MAVAMNNYIFCNVMLCGSFKNRRFGRTDRLHHQDGKIQELGTKLAVTSNRSSDCSEKDLSCKTSSRHFDVFGSVG